MNILDENIPESQRQLLERWGIRTRHVGQELGRVGMHDDEIITLLQSVRRTTLFTRDRDFANPRLCHPSYCLVRLDCVQDASAELIRRVLRHPELKTQERRRGLVVRAGQTGLRIWRRNAVELSFAWPER